MSIANEIQRLQTAKADIKSAIENKGVTVGDETIDTYAEKISQISSGASLPSCVAEINGGTWTQATSLLSGTLEIEHGLTGMPDVIVISSNIFEIQPSVYNLAYMFYEIPSKSFGYSVYYNDAITTRVNYNIEDASGRQGITGVDNNKFTITTANNRQMTAGVTYSWIAMRWEK